MTSKTIQQGAEAKIILSDNFIIKDRIPKSYRIPELDKKIRTRRTRSEAKLLEKASKIINSPKPFFAPDFFQIKMPFIEGKKLSEHLNNFSLENQKKVCRELGIQIAKLHDADIIHGDLTTSNMICVDEIKDSIKSKKSVKNEKKIIELKVKNQRSALTKSGTEQYKLRSKGEPNNLKIYIIDFGLGFISHKIEDKAVDLHLLKEALEAKHFKTCKELFKEILKGYKTSKNSQKVLEQFKKVESRGRYKEQY